MLIEFNVENFLSFKDLVTLSMVSAKSFKEHQESNTIDKCENLSLLKTAIIYGNNASGKSNLLSAIGFMKATVINSFRDALIENGEKTFPLAKFSLNTESEKETSYFEVSFIQNSKKYRYGFEIDYDKIVAEWLFHTTTKEVYLFKREHKNIEINKSSFKEGIGKEEDLKDNVLFISLLATLGKEISTNVVEWFKNLQFVNGLHDREHKKFTISKLISDEQFHNWVLHFIKYLEISNLSATKEDVYDIDLYNLKLREKDDELINLLTDISEIKSKRVKQDLLTTYHRRYDKNNVLVDSVPFNFDKQESEGTKKLLYLLGPWYEALKNGTVLIIDELDSRLHSCLTLKLIDFFHKFNNKNAQLICAVHDVSLLKKETFRRDQIWFVEKNQFGASELFSLSDFKTDTVRNKSAFAKNYLEGKYGAIPYFNINEKLTRLLYGKR